MATTTGALGQNITPKSDVSSRRELRFAVFDQKDTVLVLPAERGSHVAVWMSLPSLAEILHSQFESLWDKAKPALLVLRKIKEAKAQAQ